jgi:hypothetical protein
MAGYSEIAVAVHPHAQAGPLRVKLRVSWKHKESLRDRQA